jgi:hypothetical protein
VALDDSEIISKTCSRTPALDGPSGPIALEDKIVRRLDATLPEHLAAAEGI